MTISAANDGERIYVSVDHTLPNEVMDGMLTWFGMDMSRNISRARYENYGRYFVQAIA